MTVVLIDAGEVQGLLRGCLYADDELGDGPPESVPADAVKVEGCITTYAFHPERLAATEPRVAELLALLPKPFQPVSEGGGGGWSLLNGPFVEDERGELVQWGEQFDADALFVLGMGVGLAVCLVPRRLWGSLPGGLPYYGVRTAAEPDAAVAA